MPLPRPKKLSRGEMLPVMLDQPTDAALRCLSAHRDTSLSALVRKAIAKAFAKDKLYQAIYSYFKVIPEWEYDKIKKQLADKSVMPEDRIPEQIQNIIKEFENV